MNNGLKKRIGIMLGLALPGLLLAEEAPPSVEEMWAMIQAQQAQIAALQEMVASQQAAVARAQAESEAAKAAASEAQVVASSTRGDLATTQAQLEATTLAVEESAGSQGGWWERTSVGGYGELHANFYEDSEENEIDFHRFVLFLNHDFNDWLSLYSEIEYEHADTSKNGAVELEQAFIRMRWNEQLSTDAGLFLMPVGIINETHEPATFYGVERPRVDSRIIPTSWREGGLKVNYRTENGLSLDAAITSGLDIGSDYRIRSGRTKLSEAPAEEGAFTARAKYTGIAGLEVAGTVYYQDDMAQDKFAPDVDFSGLLTSAHVIYNYENFSLRAMYTHWKFDGDSVPVEAEEQYGWYVEPSYRWTFSETLGDLGVFLRYSDYEYYKSGLLENEVVTFGMNWWPTDNVVFKVDYQDYNEGSSDDGTGSDSSTNLGVGYHF